uniref:Cation efflux protein cytoplasmic domain-containing protein n=1 Tax=Strigamia maritima TaxID=126957 RepID=T1JHY7_STRMM
MAVERIVNKTYDIEADIMLITSAVGVAVNIIMGFVLHCGGGHGHSHGGGSGGHVHNAGHSHNEENDDKEKDSRNINVRAALIHVIGDFIQSIGVFIAALVIYFRPDLGIMDPICTFLFSVLVLITTINILKDVILVLMEGLPRGINFSDVYETFMSIGGVVRVHNLRIWSLSMDKIAMSAHIVVNPGMNTQQILKDASNVIRKKFSFFEMTLQIEDYRAEMQDCTQCQCPKD